MKSEGPAEAGVTVALPLRPRAPFQAPLAVHVVAFVADHVSVLDAPSTIVDGFAVSVTVAAGGAVAVTFAVAFALPPVPVHVSVKSASPTAAGVTASLPLVDFAPPHAPAAEQEVALVDDQVSVDAVPNTIEAGAATKDTVGTGGVGVEG